MINLIHAALDNPFIFELQQKLCNNYHNIADEFSEYLSKPTLDVLDVGCSTGTCAGTIIDMKRHHYTGVDIVPHYSTYASKKWPNGRFLTMDARKMSFDNESFDLAMYTGVLHHMDDETARACLRDTRRVLRKDGHVIIVEPVFTKGMWMSRLLLLMDRGRNIRDDHGYRALLSDFTIVRERHLFFANHRYVSFVLKP